MNASILCSLWRNALSEQRSFTRFRGAGPGRCLALRAETRLQMLRPGPFVTKAKGQRAILQDSRFLQNARKDFRHDQSPCSRSNRQEAKKVHIANRCQIELATFIGHHHPGNSPIFSPRLRAYLAKKALFPCPRFRGLRLVPEKILACRAALTIIQPRVRALPCRKCQASLPR